MATGFISRLTGSAQDTEPYVLTPEEMVRRTVDPEVAEVVLAGAALLDEVLPPGWEQGIDLVTLDQQNIHDCVLGQLFGRFGEGLAALGITESAKYGFASYTKRDTYHELTRAWKTLIGARR